MKHLQINTFKNISSPTVLSSVTPADWFKLIKESEYSDFIIESRLTTGVEYDKRKKQIPCTSFNFLYDKYKNNRNILLETGLMYIDIDDEKFNISTVDTNKIFAYYKSFGGKGYAIIVQVDGLSLDNFNSTYFEILVHLGLEDFFDKNAMKATQFNVLSYDKDLFFNPNSYIFQASLQNTPQSNVIEKKKKIYTIDGGVKSNEYTSIRFNNLADIEIPKGEYVVNWEGYDFINCFIPMKKINTGNRNNFLLGYCNNLVYLNPTIKKERIIKTMCNVNYAACFVPVNTEQVISIVTSMLKYKLEGTLKPIYFWKKRKIVFRQNSILHRDEKLEICRAELSIKKCSDSRKKLYDIIENWDFETYGKISQSKIYKNNPISSKTVEKYYSEFKDYIQDVNADYNLKKNKIEVVDEVFSNVA